MRTGTPTTVMMVALAAAVSAASSVLTGCNAQDAGGPMATVLAPTAVRPSPEPKASHHSEGRGSSARPRSQSTLTPGCPGNDPNTGGPYDVGCANLSRFCADTGRAGGSLTWTWSRPLAADGTPTGRWQRAGLSCNLPEEAVEQASMRA